MDLGTSALLQHALAEFMDRGYLRAHLSRILPEYRRRREALEAALGRYLPADVTWQRPSSGVALWLPLPSPRDPDALFEEAQRQGVLVSPGSLNAVDRRSLGVRLTFCAEPVERLVEGARRLGRALALLDRRGRPPARPAEVQIEVV
jgi:DNA-binding transcriptional MocR family regulator